MRKIIVLCLLAMFVQPAFAKLYKCKDAEGNTVYTDEACADGKQLKLPPLPTYTAPKPLPATSTGNNDNNNDEEAKGYISLVISKPENDGVIRDNEGKATISYTLTPELKTELGHKFVITLDGKQLKTSGTTSQIQLSDLDRGTHTIQINVMDKENKTVISSKPTSFHMMKFSILHPRPISAPPAAPISPPSR